MESPDARYIRESLSLSQEQFAGMIGIGIGTLRNWEQGRRAPEGPARVLLNIAALHPNVVWDTVQLQKLNRPAEAAPKPAAELISAPAPKRALREKSAARKSSRKPG